MYSESPHTAADGVPTCLRGRGRGSGGRRHRQTLRAGPVDAFIARFAFAHRVMGGVAARLVLHVCYGGGGGGGGQSNISYMRNCVSFTDTTWYKSEVTDDCGCVDLLKA